MSPRNLDRAIDERAPIFAALGDSTRLRLVSRLSDGQSQSITQLHSGIRLSRQGLTKHLRTLEDAGVVTRQRVGRESRYSLRPQPIAEVRDFLRIVSDQWDDAAQRLKNFVEGVGD